MAEQKTISVCMPMHEMKGYEFFLRRNLDILSEQSFKDFDVIVSDHSKADNIKNICESYKDRLDIHFYRNPTGPYTSGFNTNNVLSKATGKLIKIIFLDDYLLHKDALKDIVDAFDMEKDHWLVTACEHTYDGVHLFRPFYPKFHDKIHLGDNTISSPSVVTIKNEPPLIHFDPRMVWLMDVDYYKRMYDKYGPPKILNSINVVNTNGDHQASNTSATRQRRAIEYVWVLKKHKEWKLLFKYYRKINPWYSFKFWVWKKKAELRKTPSYATYISIKKRFLTRTYKPTLPTWKISLEFRLARILNSISNFRARNRQDKQGFEYKKFDTIKNVIFVHSQRHFDPLDDANPERPFHFSSTGSIARHVWKLLEGKQRFFINIKTLSRKNMKKVLREIPEPDLIIGLLSDNFLACAKAYPNARKILLLVNCHPMFRAQVLLDEIHDLKKPLPSIEWVKPNILARFRSHIDAIALIGNKRIKETFSEYGLVEIPIFPLSLGVNTEVLGPKPELRSAEKIRFIYPATDMGIRKGFLRMIEAWKKLNTMMSPEKIELIIVGQESFPTETREFVKAYTNVKHLGWPTYLEQVPYLQSSHVVLGPSLEEGQVGWVVEAMSCGAVPVITPECGIDIRDGVEGLVIKDYTDADEIALHMKKLATDTHLREKMSKAVLKNIEETHTWKNFREAFKRIIDAKK